MITKEVFASIFIFNGLTQFELEYSTFQQRDSSWEKCKSRQNNSVRKLRNWEPHKVQNSFRDCKTP